MSGDRKLRAAVRDICGMQKAPIGRNAEKEKLDVKVQGHPDAGHLIALTTIMDSKLRMELRQTLKNGGTRDKRAACCSQNQRYADALA